MFNIRERNEHIHYHMPLTNREEIHERIQVILQQERTNYARCDHVSLQDGSCDEARLTYHAGSISNTGNNKAGLECRVKMCDWSYLVVDQLKMDREVVLTSMYFIDKFLSNQVRECNAYFIKLIAITSLFLASKLYGSQSSFPSLDSLTSFCHLGVTADIIEKLEIILLRSLKFYVNPPTAKVIIQELLGLLVLPKPADDACLRQVSNRAHFFAELSVYDMSLVGFQAMAIAMASLLNALELVGEESNYLLGKTSFLDEFCSIINMRQEDNVVEDIGFVQSRLWSLYSHTEENDSRREEVSISPKSLTTVPVNAS